MDQKVFISHSSKDHGIAQDLCDFLEQRGIGCWLAPRDVPSGDMFAGRIVAAIKACHVVAVLLTEASVGSQHVLREVLLATREQKYLLPIMAEPDVKLSTSLDYLLSIYQHISIVNRRIEDVGAELAVIVAGPYDAAASRPELSADLGLAEMIRSFDGRQWDRNRKTLVDQYRADALHEIPVAPNLVAGVEAAMTSHDESWMSLLGVQDAFYYCYAIATQKNLPRALAKVKEISYKVLSDGWAAYDETPDVLRDFIRRNPVAKWIYAEAVAKLQENATEQRAYMEGSLRGFFIAARSQQG